MTFIGPDLTFTLERHGARTVRGRLRGSQGRIVLEVDDARALGTDGLLLRAVADGLAQHGMTFTLRQGERDVASLGASSAWWQRALERSRTARHLVLLRHDG